MTTTFPAARRRGRHRPAWDEQPTRAGSTGKAAALTIICLVVLGPLWTVVLTSFSSQKTINEAGGLVIVPGEFSLDAYTQIIEGGIVTRAVLVSLGITVVGTAISMVVSVLGAYGLSRSGSYGHRTVLFVLIITLFFGAGMIPTYLLVSALGLIDTYWSLILPTALSAFNVLLLRNSFMNMDRSVMESARLDGAGEWRVLAHIVLPMSKAVLAVVSLFYAVGYWNSFFQATLYINDPEKLPLQVVLRAYVLQGQTVPGQVDFGTAVAPLAVQMAVVVIALVPVLLVYPFVQRHFGAGVLIGAVKG